MIDEIMALAQRAETSDPDVAVVLHTLAGAMMAGHTPLLAVVCKRFAAKLKAELEEQRRGWLAQWN